MKIAVLHCLLRLPWRHMGERRSSSFFS